MRACTYTGHLALCTHLNTTRRRYLGCEGKVYDINSKRDLA